MSSIELGETAPNVENTAPEEISNTSPARERLFETVLLLLALAAMLAAFVQIIAHKPLYTISGLLMVLVILLYMVINLLDSIRRELRRQNDKN